MNLAFLSLDGSWIVFPRPHIFMCPNLLGESYKDSQYHTTETNSHNSLIFEMGKLRFREVL